MWCVCVCGGVGGDEGIGKGNGKNDVYSIILILSQSHHNHATVMLHLVISMCIAYQRGADPAQGAGR